jgi:hypothetical protein
MLTLREVRQRLSLINARIQFDKDYGEYRVTLQEWPLYARRTEDRAYYTNDLEDALFTAQSMRRKYKIGLLCLLHRKSATETN